MTDNTNRFTGRAEDYDRYRQRYPEEEVLAYLRVWCGLTPAWQIADIGAGTGMLAEMFLVNGNRVQAVEPNREMRERMLASVAQQIGAAAPGFATRLEILDAAAEATTLADASVDMVAAGRAFHWFDKERAVAEFRRILKPGGWVLLIALDRSRESDDPKFREQIEGYEQLMQTHSPDYVRVRAGYRTYENMENIFGADAELHQAQIHGERTLDWETFRGHTMSLSISPARGHANHDAFLAGLCAYFDAHAVGGIFTMPTTCWITAARLA